MPGLGLFQFKRMPYGLSQAGVTFQRLVDKVIGPELEPFAFPYLDDIIIATEKTQERVARLYFWPKLCRSVRDFVQCCLVCQQTKAEQKPPAGPMGQRIVERPWQVVAGNVTGLFTKSRNGYEYILVFQNLFTHWVKTSRIWKANAKTIVKEFKEKVVWRFGTPEVFLSDNGRELKNRLVDEYLASLGIFHSTTPPYHPQANPVERLNRTLKTRLIAFIEGAHADWDRNLPELVSSLNNSVHSSKGVSPALLNYGRQPLLPTTKGREQERAALAQRTDEATDAWLCRLKGLDRLREEAASRASKEHARQAVYYNARRREHTYEVGDLVWKKNRILSSAAQGVCEASAEVRRPVQSEG